MFMYAGTPDYDIQENKKNSIKELNEKRHDYDIYTKYKQAPLVKSTTTNQFKKTGNLRK